MIQTIGLSVGAAVAYIIVVLGLMFYCKKRRNAKRLQKGQDGEEPEMECLNGGFDEGHRHPPNVLIMMGYLLPSYCNPGHCIKCPSHTSSPPSDLSDPVR